MNGVQVTGFLIVTGFYKPTNITEGPHTEVSYVSWKFGCVVLYFCSAGNYWFVHCGIFFRQQRGLEMSYTFPLRRVLGRSSQLHLMNCQDYMSMNRTCGFGGGPKFGGEVYPRRIQKEPKGNCSKITQQFWVGWGGLVQPDLFFCSFLVGSLGGRPHVPPILRGECVWNRGSI